MTFEEVVRFHGHRCPGLAMGYRMATAAMEALNAVRSRDEELAAIVENDACGVDALQCLTGCTFGKGNLGFLDYGKQVYTVYARTSGAGVRVHFHGKGIPADLRDNRAQLTDWILTAPAESLLSVSPATLKKPGTARIMTSTSCAFCGESVMATRVKTVDGKPACIPCSERAGQKPSSPPAAPEDVG